MLDTSLDEMRTTEVRRALHQLTRAVRNGDRKQTEYEREILKRERAVVQEVINAYRAWIRGKAADVPSEPAPGWRRKANGEIVRVKLRVPGV